jgi:MFS transporter, Spinster family, sphingosine-1-phosphate transporter
MMGAPLRLLIGYFGAGWLNELHGWRMTFVALGLPGLALALLAWLTLREPRSASLNQRKSGMSHPKAPGLLQVLATLWANVTFRHLLFCYSVIYFFGYGILQWQPTFFIRSYGLQTGELGTWFAAIYGVGGMLGTYLGGVLASRHAAGNEPLQLRAMALAFVIFGVLSSFIYVAPSAYVAFGLMAVVAITLNLTNGPLVATIQTLVPERMRAMSIALIYLFANLIGMGLGPLAAGALSDGLRPIAGEESLRYALLILSPGYCWGAWHVWRASRTIALS